MYTESWLMPAEMAVLGSMTMSAPRLLGWYVPSGYLTILMVGFTMGLGLAEIFRLSMSHLPGVTLVLVHCLTVNFTSSLLSLGAMAVVITLFRSKRSLFHRSLLSALSRHSSYEFTEKALMAWKLPEPPFVVL